MKVLNAEQTRSLEKSAVKAGISYLQLMENAGAAAARFIKKRFPVDQKRVVVLCGKGNNGGDGFVAARHLAELGAKVIVVLVEGQPGTDIAREMYEKLADTAVKTVDYLETPEMIAPMLSSADFIVDAIYGIGFHGSIPEYLHPLFIVVKSCSAMVISLDVPSGVLCDTGSIQGKCIRANYTVSFTTLKNAHLLQPGKTYCGQVAVVPVGITSALINRQPTTLEVTEQHVARAMVKPRKPESNKGSYGRLLCVCGSVGMAGAAVLSAKAAVRCGAGLVNVALPSLIYPIVAQNVTEPTYTLLNNLPNGMLSGESERNLFAFLSRSTACLIGCGMGKSAGTTAMVTKLISTAKCPLVIDADGINIVAEHIDVLKTAKGPVVMTPHPGEMARLLKTTVADVQAHRLEYARKFAAEHNVTMVLKGAGTIAVSPEGKAFLNITGNPGMAKAGSGDVLAGMIASFVAQGVNPLTAAAGAVYLHGLAGDRCAQQLSKCAMLPTDMIEKLPELFLEIER
ncbi:bifunctional ADP-dependent NAD(P)H-hydrate dehydratase/NAD(P)H-hydrate epimerase [Anaeromassilibacillus senegalensis]|uniref:bifunctional ADP-dependent NAD(P)H-hydrate dehydratase/NAD(P)H-hydrate epimerase n=1 Tax=Anaeromassilibacillus senegalensis TaxID=1673717 RepID=UPI00093E09FE|nr:bifunctional ADP-dependent NAD(P)H-hydrate dehydratase/NAD(P)H-hydrate epimerase [Anaeromassilibacillus senegalensis]